MPHTTRAQALILEFDHLIDETTENFFENVEALAMRNDLHISDVRALINERVGSLADRYVRWAEGQP